MISYSPAASRARGRGRRLGAAFALVLAAAPVAAVAQAPFASLLRSTSASDRELSSLYAARGWSPIFVRGNRVSGEAGRFIAALRGLGPGGAAEAAMLDAYVARARSGDPRALADAETRLADALVAHVGEPARLDVGMTYVDADLRPKRTLPRGNFMASRDLRAAIDALRTANPIARPLHDGLSLYRARWASLPAVRIPAGGALRPGARGARVEALRRRLGLVERGTFDAAAQQALRAYKNAHGLGDNSTLDARTLASLNGGAGSGERLIQLNIARAHAIPDNPGIRFILVDAASSRMWMYERGRPVDSMKVIVGKQSEQTPMMAAKLRYGVLNPYWNVPVDLTKERIARGAMAGGQAWLRERGYEVLSDWSDRAVVVHPSRVDWAGIAAGRHEARVRQRPGGDNMMGKMKLMMPNRMGIWLHDTPDKHLFREQDRHLSSGCVRLEDADRVARWLYGRPLQPRTGAAEERVAIPRPVPVYITYLTASAAPAGGIAYHADVYGLDRPLLAQLEGNGRLAGR